MTNIRNFVIISHIDHGKSTLADRLIELTGTVPKEKMKPQLLDSMELERERGITIKMAPVRMLWQLHPPMPSDLNHEIKGSSGYVLNLIDTPGHVDFSYEVSRALACVEGAVLLVDATKGIQAQTLSNFRAAQKAGLKIVGAVNKIDLPSAEVSEVELALGDLIERIPEKISAKTGQGVDRLLAMIVNEIPGPKTDPDKPFKALIFDSLYDEHRGVIAYIRVFDGKIARGDRVELFGTGAQTGVLEVGYFHPERRPGSSLSAGEIGYIVTDLKSLEQAKVGDTITKIQMSKSKFQIEPIPGFTQPKPMVFASVFPVSSADTPQLRKSLERLKLNDAALQYDPTQSKAFGPGFKLGCLGLLHLEIVKERLEREFKLELVVTTPSVAYRERQEPFVHLEIVTPSEYLGAILELINHHRGTVKTTESLEGSAALAPLVVIGEAPLAEIIVDFYDELKSVSRGYATMDYELVGYRESDLVSLDVLVAGEKVEPFSQIVHTSKLQRTARQVVERLKVLIPRQNFEVRIQAAVSLRQGYGRQVGSKIIASERIPPLRKDVTAKLYGGDVTRKRKLLERQKAGKARMKQFGRVEIPTEVFLQVLKRSQ